MMCLGPRYRRGGAPRQNYPTGGLDARQLWRSCHIPPAAVRPHAYQAILGEPETRQIAGVSVQIATICYRSKPSNRQSVGLNGQLNGQYATPPREGPKPPRGGRLPVDHEPTRRNFVRELRNALSLFLAWIGLVWECAAGSGCGSSPRLSSRAGLSRSCGRPRAETSR